jgi:hypothetical protein
LILDAAARVLERLHVRGAEHARGALERGALVLLATGCAYYYKVVDTSNGQVYYTTDVAREPNNVRFKDARTGKEMVIPTAKVQSITQDEYRAGLGR